MITRIELKNFMSHKATVIEPAPGLTVLVGPNNCGKSAVVAALRILCHNESSTYVLRHGERECSVKVETDDGHTILWRRKNSPSYVIDGETFDRLKSGGLPEPLHQALRLPKVEAGEGDEFDVHFGEQKAPIFLLGDSQAKAARFFASSSDAIRLVEMQRRHKEKVAARQRETIRLQAEAQKLAAEAAALAPAVALGPEVEQVEALFVQCENQAALAEQLGRAVAEIASRTASVQRSRAEAAALTPVVPPPVMQDEQGPSRLIEQLEQAASWAAHNTAKHAALASLAPPPVLENAASLSQLADDLAATHRTLNAGTAVVETLRTIEPPPALPSEHDLARTLDKLAAAARQAALARASVGAIGQLPPLPAPCDSTPLAGLVDRIQAAADQVAGCQSQAAAAGKELSTTLAALRTLAESSVCPACGGPLDLDRVLKRAELGFAGGHAHA
jgi:exonuclease SbcC